MKKLLRLNLFFGDPLLYLLNWYLFREESGFPILFILNNYIIINFDKITFDLTNVSATASSLASEKVFRKSIKIYL